VGTNCTIIEGDALKLDDLREAMNEIEGKVSYQYRNLRAEQERMDYLEFIARITSHIRDKGQVMICCPALYSNVHRDKMHKTGAGSLRLKRKGSEKEDFMRLKELIAQE
jgi:hypothetical protein